MYISLESSSIDVKSKIEIVNLSTKRIEIYEAEVVAFTKLAGGLLLRVTGI